MHSIMKKTNMSSSPALQQVIAVRMAPDVVLGMCRVFKIPKDVT